MRLRTILVLGGDQFSQEFAHVLRPEVAVLDKPVGELADALERTAVLTVVARQLGRQFLFAVRARRQLTAGRARCASMRNSWLILRFQIREIRYVRAQSHSRGVNRDGGQEPGRGAARGATRGHRRSMIVCSEEGQD